MRSPRATESKDEMTDVIQNHEDLPAEVPADDIHDHVRTGLDAADLREAITDHLRYSIGRPAAAVKTRALLPGTRLGRARPHAGQPRGLDPDVARPRAEGDVLPVGRVPDGAAAGQQPAQPRDRGRRPRGAGLAGPGLRRGAGVRAGAGARQRRARQARRVLPRLAGHPRAPGDRLRHPLRVRHLRAGVPRRLAGREDRQLARRTETLGRSPNPT